MQCPCGGSTTLQTHTVKSMPKITEWLGREHPNPVRIENNACESCGRQLVIFFDAVTGQKIGERE